MKADKSVSYLSIKIVTRNKEHFIFSNQLSLLCWNRIFYFKLQINYKDSESKRLKNFNIFRFHLDFSIPCKKYRILSQQKHKTFTLSKNHRQLLDQWSSWRLGARGMVHCRPVAILSSRTGLAVRSLTYSTRNRRPVNSQSCIATSYAFLAFNFLHSLRRNTGQVLFGWPLRPGWPRSGNNTAAPQARAQLQNVTAATANFSRFASNNATGASGMGKYSPLRAKSSGLNGPDGSGRRQRGFLDGWSG